MVTMFICYWHTSCNYQVQINLEGGERKMKKRISSCMLAGALVLIIAMPVTVFGAQGNGKMKRQAAQTQTRTMDRDQDQLRLRDGSCKDRVTTISGVTSKSGNTYGPGDGTGNMGIGPKDGTGYGAPSQR